MSVLGFVKAQRLPGSLVGEDEVFQKELSAIRSKLTSKSSAPRIYRAGRLPTWIAPNSTEAATSTIAIPAVKEENDTPLRAFKREAAAAAASSTSGGTTTRRVLHDASLVDSSTAAAAAVRRPFIARLVDTSEVDQDGDARMEEGSDDEDQQGEGRHSTDSRRRTIEAAVIVDSSLPVNAAAAVSNIQIDTSQLDVPEPEADDEDAEERETLERRRRARLNAARREEEEYAESKRREEEEKKRQEEEAAAAEEEEEESEYESDSDDERRRMMFKPIYRSKAQRATLADRDRIEAEEAKLEADRVARLSDRKKESKLLVLAELQKDVAAEQARAAAGGNDVGSDGEGLLDGPVDPEHELDLWKLRELRRIKRDREERKAYEEERAQVERRRNMTDAEIAADNERLGIERVSQDDKAGTTMRFQQRYYHKGGFYQDEDSLREMKAEELVKRDFHAPTGEDRTVDKSTLPKVMQVKKFAMKGRTKYTHLVDQDTTRRDENPWTKRNTLVQMHRPTGAGDVISSNQHKKPKPSE